MAAIHDGMPVILAPDDYNLWLDPQVYDKARLLNLMRLFPADQMRAYPVSTLINNPRNENRECIEPLQAQGR